MRAARLRHRDIKFLTGAFVCASLFCFLSAGAGRGGGSDGAIPVRHRRSSHSLGDLGQGRSHSHPDQAADHQRERRSAGRRDQRGDARGRRSLQGHPGERRRQG